MPISKPYAGLSEDRLIALINTDSGTSYALGQDINFGIPTPYSGEAGRNTRLQVLSATTIFTTYIQYWRLPLSVLGTLTGTAQVDPVEVSSALTEFDIADILPQINLALGLDLQLSEVENTHHFAGSQFYRLTITGQSLTWIPQSFYDFEVTYVA